MTNNITIHGILAGAYRGKGLERTLLTHASADGGVTALCRTIKADSLCDEVLDEAPSCARCERKVADRRKLPRFNGPQSYTSHQRYWHCRVLEAHRDVYITPGIGWCGPGWQIVDALMARIAAGESFGPESWATALPSLVAAVAS
ncbi:MAG TPA: hypothetical protein VMZ53_03615 [Kofleriaceae bacterium]|nr:hypothetical protein [Kofleriaceae bacterium]